MIVKLTFKLKVTAIAWLVELWETCLSYTKIRFVMAVNCSYQTKRSKKMDKGMKCHEANTFATINMFGYHRGNKVAFNILPFARGKKGSY